MGATTSGYRLNVNSMRVEHWPFQTSIWQDHRGTHASLIVPAEVTVLLGDTVRLSYRNPPKNALERIRQRLFPKDDHAFEMRVTQITHRPPFDAIELRLVDVEDFERATRL